jgi:hypothetical protein
MRNKSEAFQTRPEFLRGELIHSRRARQNLPAYAPFIGS